MKRNLAALVLSVALAGSMVAPSLAEDPAPAAKSTAGGSSGDVNIATRLASFMTGVVVGTPIAVVRKTVQCTVSNTKELVGENRNPIFLVPAGMVALPWGMFSGGVEGLYYGTVDSWVNSGDKPFGKETFSLGEMK